MTVTLLLIASVLVSAPLAVRLFATNAKARDLAVQILILQGMTLAALYGAAGVTWLLGGDDNLLSPTWIVLSAAQCPYQMIGWAFVGGFCKRVACELRCIWFAMTTPLWHPAQIDLIRVCWGFEPRSCKSVHQYEGKLHVVDFDGSRWTLERVGLRLVWTSQDAANTSKEN